MLSFHSVTISTALFCRDGHPARPVPNLVEICRNLSLRSLRWTYRYLHRRPAGLSGRRLAQRTRGAGSLCCNDLSLLPAEYVGNLVAPCAGAASGSMIGVIESSG